MLEECTGGVFACNIRVEQKLEHLNGTCSEIQQFNSCAFEVISYKAEKFEVNVNLK